MSLSRLLPRALAIAIASSSLLVTGCGGAGARARMDAARDMDCPESDIHVIRVIEQHDHATVYLEGCNRDRTMSCKTTRASFMGGSTWDCSRGM